MSGPFPGLDVRVASPGVQVPTAEFIQPLQMARPCWWKCRTVA